MGYREEFDEDREDRDDREDREDYREDREDREGYRGDYRAEYREGYRDEEFSRDEWRSGGRYRQEYEDFVSRYDAGHPSEGYDDDEVRDRYQRVSRWIPLEEYEESARESFERMSSAERREFGQYMQGRARSRGISDPAWDEDDDRYEDAGYLSQVSGRLERQEPGMLGRLLGDEGGGFGGSSVRGGLAGIAAAAARRMMGRQ